MKWHFFKTVIGYVTGIDLSNKNLNDVPTDIPSIETSLNLAKKQNNSSF